MYKKHFSLAQVMLMNCILNTTKLIYYEQCETDVKILLKLSVDISKFCSMTVVQYSKKDAFCFEVILQSAHDKPLLFSLIVTTGGGLQIHGPPVHCF